VLQALKVVAVAVVAQAVVSMAGTLTPDVPRRLLALLVAAIVLLHGGAAMQVVALAASALVGAWLLRGPLNAAAETNAVAEEKAAARPETPSVEAPAHRVPHRVGAAAAMLFPALIVVLPLAASLSHERWLEVAAAFFRAGALVFGAATSCCRCCRPASSRPGGSTNLPSSRATVRRRPFPGRCSPLPPTWAASLARRDCRRRGAATVASGSALAAWGAAALCLVAIFVPGILVLIAALPWWEALRAKPALRRAIAGVNAGSSACCWRHGSTR